MTVALGNVGDVALAERFDPVTAVRTEHGDLKITGDNVLPFIGVRVPVQFAQAARFQIEDYAGHGLGNRKAIGADTPPAPELMNRTRLLSHQPVFVRGWRRL